MRYVTYTQVQDTIRETRLLTNAMIRFLLNIMRTGHVVDLERKVRSGIRDDMDLHRPVRSRAYTQDEMITYHADLDLLLSNTRALDLKLAFLFRRMLKYANDAHDSFSREALAPAYHILGDLEVGEALFRVCISVGFTIRSIVFAR